MNDLSIPVGADLTNLQAQLDKARAELQTFAKTTTGDVKLGLFGNTPDFMKQMLASQESNLKIRDTFLSSLSDAGGVLRQRGRTSGDEFRKGLEGAMRGMEGASLVNRGFVEPLREGLSQAKRQAHFMVQDIAVVLGQGGENVMGRAMMAASNNVGMLGMGGGNAAMMAATGASVLTGLLLPGILKMAGALEQAVDPMKVFEASAERAASHAQRMGEHFRDVREFTQRMNEIKDPTQMDKQVRQVGFARDDASLARSAAQSDLQSFMRDGLREIADISNRSRRIGRAEYEIPADVNELLKMSPAALAEALKELPGAFEQIEKKIQKLREANEDWAEAERKLGEARKKQQELDVKAAADFTKRAKGNGGWDFGLDRGIQMDDLLAERRRLTNSLADRNRPTLKPIRDNFENPAVIRGSQQDIAAVASQRAKEQASMERKQVEELSRINQTSEDMRQSLRNIERRLQNEFNVVPVRP